uniref:Major facilitator superfamily (MFS) profile domain-containing protein n=1 Tax=Chromera velia CCMP2878 TaxID=1169474 RepID=A0A0G4HGI4_9ALVE|eukprot:Cvel_1015.t1-p1 / transcript=Cvel_1015.t1 / gene=Cvel_1015 / organism=Chromera_velia_CCMP2878 / gene_product=Probable folate-biopterin transporter 2, putative / transcript_product=Probable folate-biopterin transporter 2, putative / location=Cvel_scaffold33:56438-60474(+) / protein_length=717 / sequence_SO=supercontig / SO=protein_coding / is_pseudo=false
MASPAVEGNPPAEVVVAAAEANAEAAEGGARALPDPVTTDKAAVTKQKRVKLPVASFIKNLICQPAAYVKRLNENFGWRFLAFLFCFNFILRGFTAILSAVGLNYWYEYVGVTGPEYQDVMTVFFLPWSMKGLVGTLSDTFPIFGYHKRHYMTGTVVIATGAMIALTLIDFSWVKANVTAASVLFFCVQLNSASTDVMLDGKISEFMVKKPAIKADGVSFINGMLMAGMFIFTLCSIPLLKGGRLGARIGFGLVCFGLAQMFYPTVMGWMPEERAVGNFRIRFDLIRQHWRVFLIAVTVSAFAIGLILVTYFVPSHANQNNLYVRVGYLILTAGAMLIMGKYFLKPLQYKVVVIMMVSSLLYLDLSGATTWWFLAKNGPGECNPGGPGFDRTFFILTSMLVGTAASTLAVIIFQSVFSRWTYRYIFLFTIFLKSAGAIFDIIIVYRWNIAMGIPDRYFFIFGSAMLSSVLGFLEFLPGVTLMARLSSKGCESTTQATIAAFSNYGSALAKSLGVVAIRLASIRTVATPTESCNFDNLPILIIVGQGFLPLGIIPLVWCLIPNVKLDAPLPGYGDDYDESETAEEAGKREKAKLKDAEARMPTGLGLDESGASREDTPEGDGEKKPTADPSRARLSTIASAGSVLPPLPQVEMSGVYTEEPEEEREAASRSPPTGERSPPLQITASPSPPTGRNRGDVSEPATPKERLVGQLDIEGEN